MLSSKFKSSQFLNRSTWHFEEVANQQLFWAEDSKYIIKISRKCLSKILEGGPKKWKPPCLSPPKRPSQIGLIYISIDSP
jgi:hypothetical protein